ncbi:MAG: P-loop NTPase [Longimicrobiales bacterium]
MRKIRTYHEVEEEAGAEIPEQVVAQRRRLARRLESVRHLVVVASGKGGVGKSAVTANLAAAAAREGLRVGALDADLNGPSLARMLGVAGHSLGDSAEGLLPPVGAEGVRVMSMELLQADEDSPLRWKGPGDDGYLWRGLVEAGVLREFISDVAWGELDLLLVDLPPGTDRIHRLLDIVPDLDRILLVTTPARMSRMVVSRSLRLVQEDRPGSVGLVANMTEFVCPDCGKATPLFPGAGDEELAAAHDLELWARIPFDPVLGEATDRGRPVVTSHPDSVSARALAPLVRRVLEELGLASGDDREGLTVPGDANAHEEGGSP